MPDPTKCCGTCKWWTKFNSLKALGRCDFALPVSINDEILGSYLSIKDLMLDYEGKNCPCWQAKEKTNETRTA